PQTSHSLVRPGNSSLGSFLVRSPLKRFSAGGIGCRGETPLVVGGDFLESDNVLIANSDKSGGGKICRATQTQYGHAKQLDVEIKPPADAG
ncbi:MAG TPA: hypothetical protein VGG44_02510, partial [Tepidisphaeraceae bacterium]